MRKQKLLLLLLSLVLCTACQKNPDIKDTDAQNEKIHADVMAPTHEEAMHDTQVTEQAIAPPAVENAKTSELLDQKIFRGDVVVNYASRIPFKEDGPSLDACVKALESTLILFYENERTLAPWVVIAEAIVRVDDRDAYLFSVGQGTLEAPKFYFKGAISMDNRIYAEGGNDELMFYGEIMANE